MEAGREMDIRVAEKIFPDDAFPWHHQCDYSGCFRCLSNAEHYSTDISAAWQVFEKLRQFGDFELGFRFGKWAVRSGRIPQVAAYTTVTEADTAPLAICRAALKALSALGMEND